MQQTPPARLTPDGRPTVGLVLSGGGARGHAHLGVLKVLEENRIPIDCISATSTGSVVGGLYASGMTAQEMETRLAQVNLADITFDVIERANLPQLQREATLRRQSLVRLRQQRLQATGWTRLPSATLSALTSNAFL